jgi:chitodextrinase
MTREEAKAFIDSLVKLRGLATDEMSLQVPNLYPTWKENVEYAVGDRILHNEILYKVITAHTSQAGWTPEAAPSLFAKVLIPDVDVIPEWEQPDSTNGYMAGDKVTHNGKTWISTVDNNVWEPGAYGWNEVTE